MKTQCLHLVENQELIWKGKNGKIYRCKACGFTFDEKGFSMVGIPSDPIKPESGSENDPVNHPKHYTSHPSGLECIQVTRHFGFNLGNVIKYIWRTDHKNGLEDLKKARWYLDDEIKKREKEISK